MNTFYEYATEWVDEADDIIDCGYYETLGVAKDYAKDIRYAGTVRVDIALVRSSGDEIDGLQERGYAYFDSNGNLPLRFTDGNAVPVRFLRRFGLIENKTS